MMKKGLIILLWPLWCLIPVLCTDPGCRNVNLGPAKGKKFVYPAGDNECPYLWLKSTGKEGGYNISFHFQDASSNPHTLTIEDNHWHLGMVKRSQVNGTSTTIVKVDNQEVAKGSSKLTITSTVKVNWIRWDNSYTFPAKRGGKGGNGREDGPTHRPASLLEEKNEEDEAQAEEGEEGEEGGEREEFGLAMRLVLSMLAVVIVLVMVVMVVVMVLCCTKKGIRTCDTKGSATKGRWVVERELTVPNSASINAQFYSSSDLYDNLRG